MPFSALPSDSRPVLRDLVCLKCHCETVRVASVTDRFLYLRCDGCGEVFTMTERRGIWQHALPRPTPLKARLRRVTDPQADDGCR
jgi:hypothetical protein